MFCFVCSAATHAHALADAAIGAKAHAIAIVSADVSALTSHNMAEQKILNVTLQNMI